MRCECGMCFDSMDRVREAVVIPPLLEVFAVPAVAPVALEETEARARCFSSIDWVVFKRSVAPSVPAAVERGIGRLGGSGKDISLTLLGVRVKWMVSSLLINLSKSAMSFSAESPLAPDARLVSDELRMRSEWPSPCGRPMRPFNLLDTCDVAEPAVSGRLISRALPKLPERRE